MTKIQVRKQFTTRPRASVTDYMLFSIWRRYKFESNSQPRHFDRLTCSVVFNMTKIQVRKQFTTRSAALVMLSCCFQYDEDTSSKAIHNIVLNSSLTASLFSIWRRYKFESNSQLSHPTSWQSQSCFQYDEDTSSKAIHNKQPETSRTTVVVFNMTKIQVRKQFTTNCLISDAYHELFSIWRRYKFESNSQRKSAVPGSSLGCFQYDEDTSSKAIHNLSACLPLPAMRCFQYDEDTSSKAIHNGL